MSTPLDKVAGGDTFEDWREKTNAIIDEIESLDNDASKKSESLQLDGAQQTVTQTPEFQNGLDVGGTLTPTTSNTLDIAGSVDVGGDLTISGSITIDYDASNKTTLVFPNQPASSGKQVITLNPTGAAGEGEIEFENLDTFAEDVKNAAIAQLGAAVFTETAVPVGIIHPVIGAVDPDRWLKINAANGNIIYDGNPTETPQYADLRVIYPTKNAWQAIPEYNSAGTHIIKAEKDPVAEYSLSKGDGIEFKDNAGAVTQTIDISGGKIELKTETTFFDFSGGSLTIKPNSITLTQLSNVDVTANVVSDKIVKRTSNGHIRVPNSPVDADHAVSKDYVDSRIPDLETDEDYVVGYSTSVHSWHRHPHGAALYITNKNDVIVYGTASASHWLYRFGWNQSTDALGVNINRRYDSKIKAVYSDKRTVYIHYEDNKVSVTGNNYYRKAGVGTTDQIIGFGNAFRNSYIEYVATPDGDSEAVTVYALKTDGNLIVSGSNIHGELGVGLPMNAATTLDGGTAEAEIDAHATFGSLVKDVKTLGGFNYNTTAAQSVYIHTVSNELWFAGYGAWGQSGRGSNNNGYNVFVPVLSPFVTFYSTDQTSNDAVAFPRQSAGGVAGFVWSDTSKVDSFSTLAGDTLEDFETIVARAPDSTANINLFVRRINTTQVRLYTNEVSSYNHDLNSTSGVYVPATPQTRLYVIERRRRMKGVEKFWVGGAQGVTTVFVKLNRTQLPNAIPNEQTDIYAFGYNDGEMGYGQRVARVNIPVPAVGSIYSEANKEVKEIYNDLGRSWFFETTDGYIFMTGDNRQLQSGIPRTVLNNNLITTPHVVGVNPTVGTLLDRLVTQRSNFGTLDKIWVCPGAIVVQANGGNWSRNLSTIFARFTLNGTKRLYVWGQADAGETGHGENYTTGIGTPISVHLPSNVNVENIVSIMKTFGADIGGFWRSRLGVTIFVKPKANSDKLEVYIAGNQLYRHDRLGDDAGNAISQIPRFTRAYHIP